MPHPIAVPTEIEETTIRESGVALGVALGAAVGSGEELKGVVGEVLEILVNTTGCPQFWKRPIKTPPITNS
jgi:hypothetical protein